MSQDTLTDLRRDSTSSFPFFSVATPALQKVATSMTRLLRALAAPSALPFGTPQAPTVAPAAPAARRR
jgi:hypothetical protein